MKSGFQELDVWHEATSLAVIVYKLTAGFPREEIYNLTSQIRRSAVSVAGNIAEGSARHAAKDRIRFFIISRGSIEEMRSHLILSVKLSYLNKEEFKKIDAKYQLLARRLNALIAAINKRNN